MPRRAISCARPGRDRVHAGARAPQHPKSALQEWAAAHNRKTPHYEVTDRSGPQHAPRFTVRVSLGGFAEAEATGTSKQEAETAAAAALLAQVGEMTRSCLNPPSPELVEGTVLSFGSARTHACPIWSYMLHVPTASYYYVGHTDNLEVPHRRSIRPV